MEARQHPASFRRRPSQTATDFRAGQSALSASLEQGDD